MAEQVVTVQLLGGIDESVDPDQLKSPGMKELTNVIVRKKERFQKREGYALIPQPAGPFLPATTYKGSNVTNMPIPAEAIAGHKSPAGEKVVTVADGQLFEYVGQDGLRQYRYVNDVPRAIGDVVPVDTSAGPCLEIESCIINDGSSRMRVTVWTVAQRPAAILADDSAWWGPIDGAGLYVSIQREDTGAFVMAPYRVHLPGPLPTFDVRNLRVCESYTNDTPGDSGSAGCIVMWQQGAYNSAPQLWGMRINAFAQIGNVINVTNLLTIGFQGLPPTYRSFDIAPIVPSTVGTPYRFALAVCTEDAVAPQIRWYEIDASITATWSVIGAPLDVFNPATVSRTWTPRCMRGVTMQYQRGASDGAYTLTARVGVTDPGEGLRPIDMTLITFMVNKSSGTYAALPDCWGIIRDMNYQTYEDFSQVPGYALNGSKRLVSKYVFESDFQARVDDQNANVPSSILPVMTVTMPDNTIQLYRYSTVVEFDETGLNENIGIVEPFFPGYLPTSYFDQWRNYEASRYGHTYPANLVFEVNIATTTTYSRGRQVAGYDYQVCGPANRFTGASVGYYADVDMNTVAAGVPELIPAVVDVVLERGVDSATIGAITSPSGLTNGTYQGVPLIVAGNATASATIVVAGTSITSITVTQSGYGITAGVGLTVGIAAGALYVNSPAIPALTTCATDVYAAFVIPVRGGDYDNSAVPFLHLRTGVSTLAAGTGLPALPAPVAYSTNGYLVDWSVITNSKTYSFKDGADTMRVPVNPSFALLPQSCVHRWSSAIVDPNDGVSLYVVVGITSTGANQFTSSSGEAPLSIADVHSTNNYFEAYRWSTLLPGETLLRSRVGTPPTITQYLVSALAGPWRMVGDLAVIKRPSILTVTDPYYQRVVVAITPAGDNQQRSQFLVYLGDITNSVAVIPPTIDQGESSLNWQYYNNQGMFVESMNAPRVLTVPLNSTRLFTYEESDRIGSSSDPVTRTVSITGGLLRDGSSENTCQVGAIAYSLRAESWRQTLRYADYTFINGGIMSSFDGSSCSEACIMLWPQRDLCRIATDRIPSLSNTGEQYFVDAIKLNLQSCLFPLSVSNSIAEAGEVGMAALANVTRPYFAYEAGLVPATLSNRWSFARPWASISTSFGGDPLKDYQTISVDQRMSAYNMNSAVSGDSNPGGQKAVTFYGKYGKYAQAGPTVHWVPRNVEGKLDTNDGMTEKGCFFDSIDTGCDMLMRWVYEVADGTGRVHRSGASVPSRYSIISQLNKSTKSDTITAASEFRYGFFAPRVELTNRLRTGADDNKRITLQPYTTAEPYSSVFYRMPFSSWLTPATAFVSERNGGRQLCAYEADRYLQFNPYGFVTNNLKCFDGSAGEYLGILGMPFLYTTGGDVPNMCPPSVRCMTVHQNRIVLGGADDSTVVWISKEITEEEAPAFSDLLTVRIADGGAVTGLGSLSRALIVFKSSQIHILTGDMPDNTVSGGLTASLGAPYRLVNGLGCIFPRSVVSTPVGVFFMSSRTIEMMGQNLSVTPIGLRVMDLLEEYSDVVSATHKAVDSEVVFCCQKPSVLAGTNDDESGEQYVLLVYNYADDIWSKHTCLTFGKGAATIGELNDQTLQAVGGNTYITSDTRFYDTTPDGDRWVTMSGETAPIALNQQQGYQRVKRVVLMGDPTPALPAPSTYQPHAMTVTISTDWDSTQTATWTSAEVQSVLAKQGREFFGVHVRDQKCQKVSIRFQDSPPTGGAITTGYGVAFSNIAFTVGVKSGLNKRMTQEAEH